MKRNSKLLLSVIGSVDNESIRYGLQLLVAFKSRPGTTLTNDLARRGMQ